MKPSVTLKWQQLCVVFGGSPKFQVIFTDGVIVGLSSEPFHFQAGLP
jgi:hypothetical protein